MTPHIVTSYDDDLKVLERLILDMGRTVLRQHTDGIELLRPKPDSHLAQSIIAADHSIDEMQSAIEEKAIQTIARRQPVAVDLRTIIASLRIATDLERIGDLAKNNARRNLASSGRAQLPEISANLIGLAERVAEQIGDALDAFEKRDHVLAKRVWTLDAEIDTLQTSIFRELLTYMMEDPRSIGYCTHLLFCARNLERMGDHATNIAEQIHYIVVGKPLPIERPRGVDVSDADAVP
jgi:phosphate transport system protein